MKKLKVILIGAGNRGCTYTDLMSDERFEVVGVAEPERAFREYIQKKHKISDEMCFESWEGILTQPKMADIAIIATVDQLHFEPTMKAIERGYDLLLEKPVSPDYRECVEIANYAKKMGVKILVCHVLRYTPFFGKIKSMINENMLGKVMSIHHAECVGNLHQGHSFVRGNWGNSNRSSSMILQKSCHDMDIIQWLIDKPCKRVQSFGSLSYFTRENAPDGSTEYCIDECPHADSCYYNAVKFYLGDEKNVWREVITKVKNPTDEQLKEALRTTQYGKCVFKCDNDVVDRQVVNLEFEGGAVASFNMCAFNEGGRFIRIMGSNGEIYGNMDANIIEYFSFATREKTIIKTTEKDITGSIVDGHGGGDEGIVNTLYKYITEGYDGDLLSEIQISTKNHLIAFAAEKSRVENKVIDIKEFEQELGFGQ